MDYLEISPEDLFLENDEGKREINQELIESYGLFNLSRSLFNSVVAVYLDNAARKGLRHFRKVETFSSLSHSIKRFPSEVVYNFKYGKAYKYNLRMLRIYTK